jgi:hypothetical protein
LHRWPAGKRAAQQNRILTKPAAQVNKGFFKCERIDGISSPFINYGRGKPVPYLFNSPVRFLLTSLARCLFGSPARCLFAWGNCNSPQTRYNSIGGENMPKRFSRSGASSTVAHRAYVAQASSLHTALSSKCGVGAGCASPDFAGPPQRAVTHLPGNSANPIMERTGGVPPPNPKRRLRPPHSTYRPPYRGTLAISGANLMYEGARVKSWTLGRDVNPAGRGDGAYYAQGAFSIGTVRPTPTTTPVGHLLDGDIRGYPHLCTSLRHCLAHLNSSLLKYPLYVRQED